MAKRFIIDDEGTLIDLETDKKYDCMDEVVVLLNQLDDANEILLKHTRYLHNDLHKITQIAGGYLR